MKKLSEMNASELSTCLCKISRPAENLFSDIAVRSAQDELDKVIEEKCTVETGISAFALILYPVLMNDSHKRDTYEIIAALNESTVQDEEARNGYAFTRDAFNVFVREGDVRAIFRPYCEARGGKD